MPTFHRYRLGEPQKIKKPQTIFVGSMADIFGEWMPDGWIEEVFKACEAAPWHRYLFLTKNPNRYAELATKSMLPTFGSNNWYGSTVVDSKNDSYSPVSLNTFLSVEPLQSPVDIKVADFWGRIMNWVIVGAETGNRKDKITPKREWVKNIVEACRAVNVPVFLKNNLQDIWQEPLPQEFPWEVQSEKNRI